MKKPGFGSEKYDKELAIQRQRRGGSRKVPKGFAMMDPERRIAFARSGGLKSGKRRKLPPEDPFDVV